MRYYIIKYGFSSHFIHHQPGLSIHFLFVKAQITFIITVSGKQSAWVNIIAWKNLLQGLEVFVKVLLELS